MICEETIFNTQHQHRRHAINYQYDQTLVRLGSKGGRMGSLSSCPSFLNSMQCLPLTGSYLVLFPLQLPLVIEYVFPVFASSYEALIHGSHMATTNSEAVWLLSRNTVASATSHPQPISRDQEERGTPRNVSRNENRVINPWINWYLCS